MNLFVFDIDDTISETALIHQQYFIEALKELGVKNMDINFGIYKHHTDSYIARKIYETDRKTPFTVELLASYEQKVLEKFEQTKFSEITGVCSFLTLLENRNDIAIAFATGAVLKTAVYKLNVLGIPFHENQLVASNEIEDREGIVSTAIEKAKTLNGVEEFDRIFSFGDGIWDYKTAQNLNLEFVGIGLRNKEALKKAGTMVHFNDFQSDDILNQLL
jgi:phosphoglycolate phosphatase-like HAD superfamily hydrolase